MRSPLAATVKPGQIPAPIGGWNARDPLPDMKPTDAVILENFIPGTGGVALRGGTVTRNTGAPGAINSLLRYFPATGAQRLFAASAGGFYDATSGGPFAAPMVSGLNSDKWQAVMFSTPAGSFLVAASGQDTPQIFNGTAWGAMTIATSQGYAYPLDPTKLMAPAVFGNRLWFVERGSLRVWYLPLYAIQAPGVDGSGARVPAGGTAESTTCALVLDLSATFGLGGSLIAMADWTRDGGTGSNDYGVLITSAGQVGIYTGTNPNDPSSFALYGIFRIPPPIGTRCVLRAGADLAILTQTGALPLSSILSLSQSEVDEVALTDKIRGAFKGAYAQSPAATGWEMAEYPMGALLIVNVPQPGGAMQQYVMNVLTSAWCNFTGLPATTFSLLGDNLVFGTADGRIVQYDAGSQDDGQPISALALPAYSAFKTFGRKRFVRARALYTGALGYRPALKLVTDYDVIRYLLPQGPIPAAGAPWGSAWGTDWGPQQGSSARWQTIRGLAQSVASVLVNVVSNNPFRLDHIDVAYEPGGFL